MSSRLGCTLNKPNLKRNFRINLQMFYRSIIHQACFDQDLNLLQKLSIENKWSETVCKGSFNEKQGDKYYVLSMFPYPSGSLHMGHVRVYTISDALSRFHRLNGKNVLQPMGFDAFGLPAENAALKNSIDPRKWTYENIASMKSQLLSLGCSFDWDHEVITCSDEYYKFTQYIFLLLFKEGLIYQKESLVNWDPIDHTVLADEQVDSHGKSWRSGAAVEKKLLKQWFIKTTKFAKNLLEGLDNPSLENWRDIIKLQRHWIGNCDGSRFDFDVIVNGEHLDEVSIWLKYPEHVMHASFVIASPSSILGLKYKKQTIEVVNKFSGRKLPVFITQETVFDEGCDIKLGIPSLYTCDQLFAIQHGINFKENCLEYDYEMRCRVCELGISSGVGGYLVSSKLRDWLISRQRKWGTPIPVIHCDSCGTVPVDVKNLPVKLSDSPVTSCPRCAKPAEREKDTMDTFVDSSWYFLRYTDPHNSSEPFSKQNVNQLMPVDVYVGGKEHAVLHLYYSRFLCHFLHSINLLDEAEPFKRLLVQGMVKGKTYYIEDSGECITQDRVIKKGSELYEKSSQKRVVEVWEKMSKSKHNGVDPALILEEHGVDTTRLLILSEVAPQSHRNWDSSRFSGILNWQKRLWSVMDDFLNTRNSKTQVDNLETKDFDLWDARNYYIKGATFNFRITHQLSIVISKLQGLTNNLKKCNKHAMKNCPLFERTLGDLIIMLFPIAPHFSSELWNGFVSAPNRIDIHEDFFKWNEPVFNQTWPQMDNNYNLELVCKVNNGVKATVPLPYEKFMKLTQDDALTIVLSQEKVVSFLENCDILDYEFNIIKDNEATMNILIDPLQKKMVNRSMKMRKES